VTEPVHTTPSAGDASATAAEPSARALQAVMAAAVLAMAAVVAWGALGISGDAGYGGVGPNFLPWVVALALAVCGAWLMLQVVRGGFVDLPAPSGASAADWSSGAWVLGAVLLNAALLTTLGFVLSCALAFALATRGLRQAEGRATSWQQSGVDLVTGVCVSAPVYWLFSVGLDINLPALLPSRLI
jgi:putative tricarboxylic transport membrane protein